MNHSVIFECLKNQRTKILLFFVLNGYGLKASFKQKDKGLLKIAVDKYINENDNCSSWDFRTMTENYNAARNTLHMSYVQYHTYATPYAGHRTSPTYCTLLHACAGLRTGIGIEHCLICGSSILRNSEFLSLTVL